MPILSGQRVLASTINTLMNPPIFVGYASGSQSIPNNTLTDVLLDQEVMDTVSGHVTTGATDRYVCQVAGKYLVNASVTYAPLNTTGLRMAEIRLNDTSPVVSAESLIPPSSSQQCTIVLPPAYVQLAVGDFVNISALQTSGQALNIGAAGGATQSGMSLQWVSE